METISTPPQIIGRPTASQVLRLVPAIFVLMVGVGVFATGIRLLRVPDEGRKLPKLNSKVVIDGAVKDFNAAPSDNARVRDVVVRNSEATSTISASQSQAQISDESTWSFNGVAGWASILGFACTLVGLGMAIGIFRRQGRQLTEHSERQGEEFRALLEELREVPPNIGIGQVKEWLSSKDPIKLEFFSPFSVAPLFWQSESRALEVIALLKDHQEKEIALIGPTQEKFRELCEAISDLDKKTTNGLDGRITAWRGEDNNVDAELAVEEYKRVTDHLRKSWIQSSDTLASLLTGYVFVEFGNSPGWLKDEMLVFSADKPEQPSESSSLNERVRRVLTVPKVFHTRNPIMINAVREPVRAILAQDHCAPSLSKATTNSRQEGEREKGKTDNENTDREG